MQDRGNFVRFLKETSGVGAIEFALVVPFLLILYGGSVDVTRAVTFHQKLLQTTTAINDLVTQATELKKADILDSFTIADAMMAGFPSGNFAVKVSGISIDAAGVAKVSWSVGKGMTADTKASAYVLPESLRSLKNQQLIVTNATDAYIPLMSVLKSPSIQMGASARGRTRGRIPVACSDC